MTTPLYSTHAVSRSSELLSCAKTALKIAQSSSPPDAPVQQVSPNDLSLYSSESPRSSHVETILEDGLTLLRQMNQSLTTLSSLVKRRGHTNDPTLEISAALLQWEEDAKELSHIKIIPTPLLNKQQARHYEFVSAWLQAVAAQQASSLKEIMKVRGQVLQDQAQRRKLLNPATTHANHTNNKRGMNTNNNNTAVAMNSPLFTVTHNNGQPMTRQSSLRPQHDTAAMNGNGTFSAPLSHGGYGTGYGGMTASYGSASQSTGMRQRKGGGTNTTSTAAVDVMQVQIQQRQERRATQSRLESARQAESTLAELITLFGKMSTLIVQQGEVLEKVEDDVEAALGDVSAGEEEIQTLYTIKKGNRGLILKVFGILIFFIIFMRLY